jgi:hypothetical protein
VSTIRSCPVEDSPTGTRRKDRQPAVNVNACVVDDTADENRRLGGNWGRSSEVN